MGSRRDEYIELHSIKFDVENSACGECPLAECGYYYDECPNQMRPPKTIVTNAFSPGKMINRKEYQTKAEKITEEEFSKKAQNAYSHVGNKGIATRYGLRFNRRPIELIPGDNIYVVYIHGGRLPDNGVLPDDVYLTFEHVKVVA